MRLKRRVSLGSVQLDSLDERIVITGIDEAAGKDNITAVSSANGYGSRVVNTRRDQLDVTVKFAMAIKNDDMQARSELLEMVNAWAAPGGWLRVNYRPGRRIRVVLAQAPGNGDQFNWTNEFTIVFRAYSVPYWEDAEETAVSSKSASEGSTTITVPGSAKTVANVTVENKSGANITSVELTIGGQKMTFSGGTILASGQSLVIDHPQGNERIYFRARVGSSSVLKYRTGAGDFLLPPGSNTISFKASRSVRVTVSVKGRYL